MIGSWLAECLSDVWPNGRPPTLRLVLPPRSARRPPPSAGKPPPRVRTRGPAEWRGDPSCSTGRALAVYVAHGLDVSPVEIAADLGVSFAAVYQARAILLWAPESARQALRSDVAFSRVAKLAGQRWRDAGEPRSGVVVPTPPTGLDDSERRDRVRAMLAAGASHAHMARTLRVGMWTIGRDVQAIRDAS